MSYGSLWQRWSRGVSWTWINEQYRARLPDDLDASVMTLDSRDRFHAKQGPLDGAAWSLRQRTDRPLSVYLKRHFRLPWSARLAALVDPGRQALSRRRRVGPPGARPGAGDRRARRRRRRRTHRPARPVCTAS